MRNIFYKLLFICGALLSLHGCALENEIYDAVSYTHLTLPTIA